MIENFELKIVRLKTGEDVIGFVYIDTKTNALHLRFPKTFYMNYDIEYEEEMILVDWLPQAAFYSQDISFSADNILFTTYPNVEFGYEYLKSIIESIDPESDIYEKINKTLNAIKEEEEEMVPDGSYTVH
jgi:hypothetical protein